MKTLGIAINLLLILTGLLFLLHRRNGIQAERAMGELALSTEETGPFSSPEQREKAKDENYRNQVRQQHRTAAEERTKPELYMGSFFLGVGLLGLSVVLASNSPKQQPSPTSATS